MIAYGIAALLFAVALFNELQWRARCRDAILLDGIVVDILPDGDDGYFPEVEYIHRGATKRFRSAYSIPPAPFVGSTLPVMLDSTGGSPEIFTPSTRWLFTLWSSVAGLIFAVFGYVIG